MASDGKSNSVWHYGMILSVLAAIGGGIAGHFAPVATQTALVSAASTVGYGGTLQAIFSGATVLGYKIPMAAVGAIGAVAPIFMLAAACCLLYGGYKGLSWLFSSSKDNELATQPI